METIALIAAVGILIGSFFLPSPPQPYLVGAYYYTWYGPGYWTRRGHLGPPLLGLYDAADPRVAEQHIRWAKKYGLDVLAWSFWGQGHYSERNFRRGFLRARNVGAIKFAVFYEVDALGGRPPWDFDRPQTREKFLSDMAYLARNYFSHRSYFRLGGRPVVLIYTSRTFTGDYVTAIQLARDRLRELGHDVYFIGDEIWWGEPNTRRISCFDAVTAYNLYYTGIVEDGATDTALLAEKIEPLYKAFAEKAAQRAAGGGTGKRVVFHPGIIPQYDDQKVRGRRNRPIPARTPDDFVRMCLMAKEFLPTKADPDQASVQPVVWITSFNEWHEGTAVEPTMPGQWPRFYSFRLLETIRAVFKR